MSFVAKLAFVAFTIMLPATLSAAQISARHHAGTNYILIDGEIVKADLAEFQKHASSMNDAVVVLASPGGLLVPALEIGKIIRAKGFATYVPDDVQCISSCALIWVAGQPRMLSASSAIGFHASYTVENGRLLESGLANALVGRYLTLLELPETAVMFATSAPPDEVHWLDPIDGSYSQITFDTVAAEEAQAMALFTGEVGSRAGATQEFFWEKGVWMVMNTTDLDGCFAMANFNVEQGVENQSSISIQKRRNGNSVLLSFQNERFRSIKDGQLYKIGIVFNSEEIDTGWGVKEFVGVRHDNGGNALVVQLDWLDLKEDFRSEQSIAFTKDGELIDSYSLKGSAEAVQQLDRCLAQTSPEPLADPFR